LGFFEDVSPNKKKRKNEDNNKMNKMSSDMGSVPEPKTTVTNRDKKTKSSV